MIVEIIEYGNYNNISENVIHVMEMYDTNIPSGITESAFTQKGGLLAGTGSGTYAEQAPGTDGQFVKYDSGSSTGLSAGTPSVNVVDSRNLLINGSFDFAQRQTPGAETTITSEKYGPDRWKCQSPGTHTWQRLDASAVSELTCQYYGYTRNSVGGKWILYQPIPFIETIPLRGREVTFQVHVRGNGTAYKFMLAILALNSSGTADTIPSPLVTAWNSTGVEPTFATNIDIVAKSAYETPSTSSFGAFNVTGTIPSGTKNIIIAIFPRHSTLQNTLELAQAGLYIGDTGQTWIPRRYDEELELCERYYRKSYDPDTIPGTATVNGMITARAYSTSVCAIGEHFPKPMRSASPTLKAYSYNGTADKISTTALADAGTTVTLGNSSMRGPRTATDSGTGFTSGNTHLFHYTAETEL